MSVAIAEVRRRPAVAEPERAARRPADAGIKGYRTGTHRAVAPAATITRVCPLLSSMGVTRVANVTGLDRIGMPVVMVVRPNARSISVFQGKGLDLEAAKASGLMEAIESFHAEHVCLPLKLGSALELRARHPLVDLDGLPRIAGGRFTPGLPMLWIEGQDLLSDAPRWLPYEMVHANYTLPLPPGSGCFPASTNGLASGNHPLEAIVHGICEVVERDATSLWHQLESARRDASRIDPATVDDEACREVLIRLARAELDAAIWETTSDVGVPSFHCMIAERGRQAGHSGAGAGCHPAREIALLRALTEAVQVRMTYITGARDDLRPEEFTRGALAERLRDAQTLMRARGPGRSFREGPGIDLPTFEQDVRWMLDRLSAVGVRQVVAVDLTRPEFDVPVARVVIPGLEGADDGDDYVPGPRALAVRGGGR